MTATKHRLTDEEFILLPAAHGSGGFVHMRTVPVKRELPEMPAAPVKKKTAAKKGTPHWVHAILFPSRQYGAQVPRAPQMQSGEAPAATEQMGD